MLISTNVKIVENCPFLRKNRTGFPLHVLNPVNVVVNEDETRISFAQVAATVNAKTTERNLLPRYPNWN